MREIREIKAKAKKEGFKVRFFQRGGKIRLDFFPVKEEVKIPRHFESLLKIVFRGREGGIVERWMGIFATLYGEGRITSGKKIRVSGELARNVDEIEMALKELQKIDRALAKIYKDGEVGFLNEIEVFEDRDEDPYEFLFEDETEGRFFREVLVPEVEAAGGRKAQILPQLEFSSLFPEEVRDKRRVDFFLSGGEDRGMAIEIDGRSHRGREEKDAARDRLLRGNRLRTFRIRAEELKDVYEARKKFRRALKGFYEPRKGAQERTKSRDVVRNAVVVKNALAGQKQAFNGKIYVGDDPENEVFVEEIEFPWEVLSHKIETDEAIPNFKIDEEFRKGLRELLEIIFGFREFREGQEEAIVKVLQGEDTIALLPTGSGKSIIYQMIAFVLPGVGIVVEPLRALMEDQVMNLKKKGIETAVNLSGEIQPTQKKRMYKLVGEGAYNLIYMTPERLMIREVQDLFLKMRREGRAVGFVTIDEAHCISEWGHDFRAVYLNLGETARKLLKFRGNEPRILALTGTASRNVLRDMQLDLKIPERAIVRPQSFDRPEMKFRVISVRSEEKFGMLEEILKNEMREKIQGIVFCVFKTEESEFGVERVAGRLVEEYGEEKVVWYYGSDERARMRKNMRKFKEGEAEIMVATKAFGMGIDKADVRFTVHFGIPNSIEAFYQEAGRGGRDQKPTTAYIILSNDFPERNRKFLQEGKIEELRRELRASDDDDVSRVLRLHGRNYNKIKGLRTFSRILTGFGVIPKNVRKEKRIVARNRFEFEEFQKVLVRLKMLGIIAEYTIFDFANKEFLILSNKFNPAKIALEYKNYAERYASGAGERAVEKIRGRKYRNQREFLLVIMEELFDFEEEVFEKERRRAIFEMLQLAEKGGRIKNLDEADKEIRQEILKYFSNY